MIPPKEDEKETALLVEEYLRDRVRSEMRRQNRKKKANHKKRTSVIIHDDDFKTNSSQSSLGKGVAPQ